MHIERMRIPSTAQPRNQPRAVVFLGHQQYGHGPQCETAEVGHDRP